MGVQTIWGNRGNINEMIPTRYSSSQLGKIRELISLADYL